MKRGKIKLSEYSREYINNFIKVNYTTLGWHGCGIALGLTRSCVYQIGKKLSLKLPNETISKIRAEAKTELGRLNSKDICETFSNIQSPKVAYLLGYIWADGYIDKQFVVMVIAEEDMRDVEEIFLSTGNWTLKHGIHNKSGKKPVSRLIKCSKLLVSIFEKMGFKQKSWTSIESVLSFIPEKLHPYFVRGYFDGDGCISANKCGLRPKIGITSTIEQDWSGLSNLLSKNDVQSRIVKTTGHFFYKGERKTGHSSTLSIDSRKQIFNFFNYIYGPHLEKFGLKRKYNKFITVFTRKMQRNLKKNAFMSENTFEYWS